MKIIYWNPSRIFCFLILLTIMLSACGGGTTPHEVSKPDTQVEEVPSSVADSAPSEVDQEIKPPDSFQFEITANQSSRWQDIIITVFDEDGNPVPGVNVGVEQTDLDFFFDAAYNPDAAWTEIVNGFWDYSAQTSDIDERKQEYADVGFNTDLGFYFWWWKDFEPIDNDWQNVNGAVAVDWVSDNWSLRADPWLPDTRFFRVNLGPSFSNPESAAHHVETYVPDFVNYRDKDTFMEEYEEFIREVLGRGEITLGGYDLIEIGMEVNDQHLTPWQTEPNQWPRPETIWMEWVEILYDVMVIADEYNQKKAPVCLHLDHMGWDPEKYPIHLGPQPIIEALIEMEAPFDCLGFEIHPGSYPGEYDTPEFWRGFLDEMESYGKYIYIWEYAVNSSGEPDPAPSWYLDWTPPVERYTQEYQDKVLMENFRLFMEDPKVIGVALLDYQDVPEEALMKHLDIHKMTFQGGLLDGDRNQKLSYRSLKEYWSSLLAVYSGITDVDGQVVFNAIPGIFDLKVNGKQITVHLQSPESFLLEEDIPNNISLKESTNIALPEPKIEPSLEPGMEESDLDIESLSPCDITRDFIGQDVVVSGQIGFLGQDQEGTFFEITDSGCLVGVFVLRDNWDKWPQENKNMVQSGKSITVMGIVGEFEGELEIELFVPLPIDTDF